MGSVTARSAPILRAADTTSERHALRPVTFAVVGVVLVIFFLAVLERIIYAGDVMPGVNVEGIDLGSHGEVEAFNEMSALAAKLETEPLRAHVGDREVVADPSILQLRVDESATLRAAREAARSGNPVEQTVGAVLRRFRPDDVPLHMTYSEAGLAGILDGWQRGAANGGVEGGLRFEGTDVIEVAPETGTGILREEAEQRLIGALRTAERDSVELPIGRIAPRIPRAEVARAAGEARDLLQGTHDVTTNGGTVTIGPEQLAAALGTRIDGHELVLTLDAAKLRTALGASLASQELAPVDARFEVTAANTVAVVPSAVGRQVDLEKVTTEILLGNRHVTASLKEVEPARDTKWAQGLGIKEQVSTFTTRHNSGEDRVKNIHRAADLLNNTVVEPGETFSLNDAIGPRTTERGFVVAPVFYGEFTEDVGGGVSQLATTVFNAVFWGGYEDVYHKPHTIYISRYPMGREATVNYPTVDLKFKNDSGAGVLIRTTYSSNSITVTFYGDKEGKVVTEDGRKVLAERPIETATYNCPGPAGLDKNNVCARLPAGQQRLAEAGHAGIDVEFYRVIARPDAAAVRERFFWRYSMLPTKYLVGTAPPTTVAPTTTTPAAPPPTAPPPTAPAPAPTAPPASAEPAPPPTP